MNYKWAAALILVVLIAILLLPQFLPGASNAASAPVQQGLAAPLEMGFAGNYGYAVFSYNGTGSATLLSLSEQPKSSIMVLRQDYLNTERYSYFMDILKPLEAEGFKFQEVDSFAQISSANNSIIIIPSGAMPSEAVPLLDSLSQGNRIIYIGRKDLVYSGKLVGSDWFSGLANSTKLRIIVIEKSLADFYSGANYSLVDEIRANSWAELNSSTLSYSGEGRKTLFVQANNGTWLRMLPKTDYGPLALPKARLSGSESIFPWENPSLTIELNFSSGISRLVVEKDGSEISSSELDRVRGEEAFVVPLSLNSSGDYIAKVVDESGVLGAKRVHVKNLSISISRAYGNSYEFLVLLDGEPLDQADAVVGLQNSTNTLAEQVSNGRLLVSAELPHGRNVFVVSMFGQDTYVPYDNTQEDVIGFYLKYLGAGLLAVIVFYGLLRLGKKPVYRILIPDSVPSTNPELRLSSKEVIAAVLESEKSFGWKNVPLYAREVSVGLRKLAGGMDVNEGNVEAMMKRLEDKGLVKSHLGLYGLSGWGDPKQNALKRVVRDKLVQNGVSFSENANGFRAGSWNIIFSSQNAARDSIIVFEDEAEKKSYVSSLHGKERASLDIKLANGVVRLATLEGLDEFL
ncbi:MAG: hypothetical protein PHS02_01335 [Candidatus ainarchaeum sp.]|nr:hypothetical protein [Candidatus ainarchaeum sp.]